MDPHKLPHPHIHLLQYRGEGGEAENDTITSLPTRTGDISHSGAGSGAGVISGPGAVVGSGEIIDVESEVISIERETNTNTNTNTKTSTGVTDD